jgi:hypothetical protein
MVKLVLVHQPRLMPGHEPADLRKIPLSLAPQTLPA